MLEECHLGVWNDHSYSDLVGAEETSVLTHYANVVAQGEHEASAKCMPANGANRRNG